MDQFAPQMRKLGLEFFPHIANHTGRTVQPPRETWIAFGPSPRGYKRHGYLALCISRAGLHARAVVKSEAGFRPEISRGLDAHRAQLAKDFDGTRIARYESWDCKRLPSPVAAEPEIFKALAATLKDSEFPCSKILRAHALGELLRDCRRNAGFSGVNEANGAEQIVDGHSLQQIGLGSGL